MKIEIKNYDIDDSKKSIAFNEEIKGEIIKIIKKNNLSIVEIKIIFKKIIEDLLNKPIV